ncbi:hypothetical protein KCU79_g186, partial [Aureobasidium melanogenum]
LTDRINTHGRANWRSRVCKLKIERERSVGEVQLTKQSCLLRLIPLSRNLRAIIDKERKIRLGIIAAWVVYTLCSRGPGFEPVRNRVNNKILLRLIHRLVNNKSLLIVYGMAVLPSRINRSLLFYNYVATTINIQGR